LAQVDRRGPLQLLCGPGNLNTKEVLAELVAKLQEGWNQNKVVATSGEEDKRGELRPNVCEISRSNGRIVGWSSVTPG